MSGWTPLDLLPGLWVALLAGIAALALRRWYDPVPARCWALWGTLLAALFGGALFGGRILLPLGVLTRFAPFERLWPGPDRPPGNLLQADLVIQITPWLAQVRAALAGGEWPLWNALAGAGEPLLANPQAQALQPLAWLALVFPVAAAAGVLAALRVLAAFASFFLFVRRQGLSDGAALWGSATFGLSGYLLNWVGWPLAGTAALLPLLLYALALVDERGTRRDHLLLAVTTAALLLVGHPETAMYALALAAAFALSRLARRPAGRRLPLLGAWLTAGALAVGLAAPALLPAAAYLPQSHRAELLEARRERIQEEDPLARWSSAAGREEIRRGIARRLVPLAAPHAFGNSRFGGYWGERNVLNDTAGFVGTAALLAALLALAPPPRGGRRLDGEQLAIVAGVASMTVLSRPPGLAHLLDVFPVLRQSASLHSRVSLVLCFAIAFLAACAWERRNRGEIRRGAVLALAGGLAALITWAYLAHPNPRNPAVLTDLRHASLALQLGTLAAAAVLLAARPAAGGSGRRAGRTMAALAILAFAGEPLLFHAPMNPTAPAELFYPEIHPLRLAAGRLAPGERVAGLGDALHPNVASMYGLADARSSNPARPAGVLDAVRRINPGATQATDVFARPEDPLYDLLGVRLVFAGRGERPPRPLEPVLRRAGVRIYRRPQALPRVFLPARVAGCDLPTWSECTAGVRDFAATAVLRGAAPTQIPRSARDDIRDGVAEKEPLQGSGSVRPVGGSRLELLEVAPARVQARAEISGRRLVASSIYQDGGWRLLLGGAQLPTTLANGPFVAAWLPAGRGPLDLVYRPPGFLAGMLAAALALAAAAVLWVPPPAARTRSRSQTRISSSA